MKNILHSVILLTLITSAPDVSAGPPSAYEDRKGYMFPTASYVTYWWQGRWPAGKGDEDQPGRSDHHINLIMTDKPFGHRCGVSPLRYST